MQKGLQWLAFAFGQDWLHALGARGAFGQAGESLVIERMNGVSDGLAGAGQMGGNLRGSLTAGAGKQDLTAAQDEGIFGA